jgi:arylsulfatase A-like enzyme
MRCLPLILLALTGCQAKPAPALDVDPRSLPTKYPGCNVILVSFDALQAAHVGALGYRKGVTPALDEMAKDSLRFERAYSVASWTVPASMTWFTGVYPSEHRMINKFAEYTAKRKKQANLKELSPNLTTLAEAFRAEGYATGGFTGNAGVSGGFGYEAGFDVYYQQAGVFGGLDRSIPEAVSWLEKVRGRRFFLFLHGYDAHGQSTPGSGLDYRFVERGYDFRYSGSEQEQEALREEGLERGKLTLRDEDVRFWRAVYDEKVHRADELFRGFLRELSRLGLAEDTLLVVTSDHGTELYEHRRFDHGFTLYDELLRVPLIIKLPGQKGGVAIRENVSSIDVMPTILDLAGILPPARQLRGRSLIPLIRGEEEARDVFAETDYREFTFKRCVVTPDGWKLILTLETGARELYDLQSDPGEQDDRASRDPALVRDLEKKVYGHWKSLGHDLTKRDWKVGLNPVYPSQEKGE